MRYIVRNITIESKTRGSQAVEDASVRPLDRPGIPVSHQILGTWKQPYTVGSIIPVQACVKVSAWKTDNSQGNSVQSTRGYAGWYTAVKSGSKGRYTNEGR